MHAVPTVPQVNAAVTATTQAATAKITPHAPPPVEAESASRSASKIVENTLHEVTEGAEAATGTPLPTTPTQASPPVAARPEGVATDAPAEPSPLGTDPSQPDPIETSAAAPAEPPAAAERTTFVPAPANNGSTGSPLPRWAAYVWPAVALSGPRLVSLGEHLGRAIGQLVPELPTAGGSSDGARGVAGVHAAGGHPATASSSPLFARFPAVVGSAFSSVPILLFVYLGLMAVAVLAVAIAVRREILAGRHHHGSW